MGELLLIKRF